MESGKLIPQMIFDILSRFVPGAVLLCSWIVFLGQDDWRRLLDTLLGGNLHDADKDDRFHLGSDKGRRGLSKGAATSRGVGRPID